MLTASRFRFTAARVGRVAGTLLLALGALAEPAEPPVPPATTHLVGTILDPSGKPAQRALVGLLSSPKVYQEMRRLEQQLFVKVDASGRFDLPIPTALGTVAVVARCEGFLKQSSPPIRLQSSRQQVAPLRLVAGLKLTGRVLDERRQPILGAIVQAASEGSGDTIRVLRELRSTTNRDGVFEIAGLEIGNYMVTAHSKTHALWSDPQHEVDSTPASQRLEITLKKGVYLSGTVLDAAGQPIPEVAISDSSWSPTIKTTSDARGRFRIGPFEPDSGRGIDARLRGYTPLREHFGASQDDVVLVLNRNSALRGHVFDAATNQPVQGFKISIHSPKVDQGQYDHAIGQRSFKVRDGRFELGNLNAGPWTITVLAHGYLPWEDTNFELQGGVTHELAIALDKGLRLSGRIIDKASGKPLRGASVNYTLNDDFLLDDLSGRSNPPPALSDATGAFELEGVPAGTVTLRARVPGYREVVQKVSAESQAAIELAATRRIVIRGQVFAADGVTPIKAMVRLYGGSGSHGYPTDAQGRFEFVEDSPGRYRLEASTDTGRSEPHEISVVERQILEAVNLRVTPAATLRGRVSGVPAAELANIAVLATQFGVQRFNEMYGLPNPGTRAEIEATGAYRIQGLAGGATAIGAGTRTQGIVKKLDVPERGAASVDFDFADVQVSGRVTRNGRPAPGVRVYAKPLEGQPVLAFASTNATGEYALSELASGEYAISAQGAQLARIQVGRGVVQNFELAPFDISGRAIDAVTGQGLGDVSPQLAPISEGATDRTFYGYALGSNAQGDFAFREITAGEYQLLLYRAGYDIVEQRILVDSSISDLVIAMQPTAGAQLRVRGAAGEVVPAVGVDVQSSTARPMRLSVKLDRYGMGRLPPSLAGRNLRIEHGNYQPLIIERWNGAPLDIELRPLGGPQK